MRTFEINRTKANPVCPCGRPNKDGKFATQKGYAGQPVGHCHSCNKDYWDGTVADDVGKYYHLPEPIDYCESCTDAVNENFDTDLRSDFAKFLVKTFGKENADKVVEEYYLGVVGSLHERFQHSTIFWQIDGNYKGRAGKILSYDDKGKRKNYPTWWHSITKLDCQIEQCFFGEHLLEKSDNSDKPIAVVEGAKTACIMSIILPVYIWLSAEGLTGLSRAKCESIKRFDVTLFPDAGCYDQWSEKAQEYGFKISVECEKWLADGIINKGDDIADYYLNSYSPEILSTV